MPNEVAKLWRLAHINFLSTVIITIYFSEPSRPEGRYEMQVFTGADSQYHNLLHSIQRRNDTFYVVSFNRVSTLRVWHGIGASKPGLSHETRICLVCMLYTDVSFSFSWKHRITCCSRPQHTTRPPDPGCRWSCQRLDSMVCMLCQLADCLA